MLLIVYLFCEIFSPQSRRNVRRHLPCTARRKADFCDTGAIGQAGALELLREEATNEDVEIGPDIILGIIVERFECGLKHPTRSIAEFHGIVEEEIVKLIRTYDLFRVLLIFSVLDGKKLRAHGCVHDIKENTRKSLLTIILYFSAR